VQGRGQDGTCGTPFYISWGKDISPWTITLNFLLERNEPVSLIKVDEKCNFDSLCNKPGFQVESKAFSISKNTAAVDMLLLKFKVTWSVSCIEASCCGALESQIGMDSVCYFPQCVFELFWWWPFQIVFPTGLKFWENFGFLPGFGKAFTFTSFQEDGKCDSRKQWLNRWVRWTIGFRGRCLRHSFGMPSIPQAFFNLRQFNIFCTSQGLISLVGLLSTTSNKASMRATTSRSWSCGENWCSRQSAITLAFLMGGTWAPRTVNSYWCLWLILPHKEFRKGPDCMRCDLRIA